MDIKDIKIGETYNVRVKVLKKENGKHVITNTLDSDGCINSVCTTTFLNEELSAFSPITPYQPIKLFTTKEIPATYPKYDPCRLFKEGDIVEPCQVKGRWFGSAWKNRSGMRFTVTKREDEEGVMWVQDPDSLHAQDVEAVFFQLVTPVEELEPYFIEESTDGATIVLTVKKRGCSQGLAFRYCPGWGGNIFFSENHCRNHAEAERDRLNEEYRKGNQQ